MGENGPLAPGPAVPGPVPARQALIDSLSDT